jgi:YcaO-like protein with predicted kinase domain
MSKGTYKTYRRGTHRCASPSATLDRISRFLPVFGITRLCNITGLDYLGIPVVTAIRPNSRSLAVSQGKGASLEAAKVSALMESIEMYHAERFFIPGLLLSYQDIVYKYNTVDLSKVSRSAKKRLTADTKIYWNEAEDLLTGSPIWVPHALVHSDFTAPFLSDYGHFITDTNGLASGNTILEAKVHALCEVIERDALAFWEYSSENQKQSKRIDIKSISQGGQCCSLIETIQDADIHIGIWDITTDIGIPSFICKVVPSEENPANGFRPVYGSGTHLDKNIALSRAITEAAQSRLTFISGARDDQFRSIYKAYLSNEMVKKWRDEILLNQGERQFSDTCSYENELIEDDYEHIVNSLKNVGITQIASVDLTREEFNIPVVKVVVPGLESITDPESRIFGQRILGYINSQTLGV